MPYQSTYNKSLCSSMVETLGSNTKAECAYLLTYALVKTHDDILEMLMGADSLAEYEDQDDLILDKDVIPKWGDFTGQTHGGNHNTIRYAHLDEDYRVDRLPAYRQVIDLGDTEARYGQAEWKNETMLQF